MVLDDSTGSLWVIVRSSFSGPGMGPNSLLAAFIFQEPEKSGLSAAERRFAKRARVEIASRDLRIIIGCMYSCTSACFKADTLSIAELFVERR